MKNVIFLFSYLVFMGLSSCSYPTYRLQHEQADDVYWNGSDNKEQTKTLDDVKFDRPAAPAAPKAPKQPKQPKQLQESPAGDEAVGVDPNNEDARAEVAYQAWNQQRMAGAQQNSTNTNQNQVQELPAQTNSYNTSSPYTVNNYTNYNYYNGYNGYNRHGLRYRSRWYTNRNYYQNTPYWGWNNYTGWQFSYNCPSFYQPWVNPYCGPSFGPNWGYNSYYCPNYYGNFNYGYGYYNNWYNPYYPYNYGYYSPWAGGYYRPGTPVHEKNTNPSRSRPRESIGNAGKDHNDQSPGMVIPGKPFFGKKDNNEGIQNETGKIGQPSIVNPNPSHVPTVSSPVQAKPSAPISSPVYQNIEPINPVANPVVPVQSPVSASPDQNREKHFRYETIGADDGKLIQGNNGPVYVPPSEPVRHAPSIQPAYSQENPIQRNQGYIPDRSQNIQQIQAPPSNRNDFNSNSRIQERIEYQAPAPQRNPSSGGFGGFSNGGGGGSGSSGGRSGGSISRPR